MARVNIYLPDKLYERVKGAGLASVSVICQAALREAIGDTTPIEVPPPRKATPTPPVNPGFASSRAEAKFRKAKSSVRESAPVKKAAADLAEVRREPCRHPVNRRIGNQCAACYATVGAKPEADK
jgi:hypothetical protein